MVGYVVRTGLAQRERSVDPTTLGLTESESVERSGAKIRGLFRHENWFCAYKVKFASAQSQRGFFGMDCGVGTTWF